MCVLMLANIKTFPLLNIDGLTTSHVTKETLHTTRASEMTSTLPVTSHSIMTTPRTLSDFTTQTNSKTDQYESPQKSKLLESLCACKIVSH